MASLNKVMIIGNAGRDAELKFTPSGSAVSTFSLAVNYKSKGEDSTEWFNVVLFGDTAEKVSQYITKGKPVYVEGRLQTRSWEKDGEKHYRTELIANSLQLLGGGGEPHTAGAREEVDDLPF